MVEIQLAHIGIVVSAVILMFFVLFTAYDDLRKRIEDLESTASQKLREAIVNVSALPLTDNQLNSRVTRLEKEVCNKAIPLEVTEVGSQVAYAYWIDVAQKHGWIKE